MKVDHRDELYITLLLSSVGIQRFGVWNSTNHSHSNNISSRFGIRTSGVLSTGLERRRTYYWPVTRHHKEFAPFLEYLHQRAGDSLWAVEWYRGDEAELVYRRDNLDVGEVNLRAKEIHQRLIGGESLAEPQQLRELGPRLATRTVEEIRPTSIRRAWFTWHGHARERREVEVHPPEELCVDGDDHRT